MLCTLSPRYRFPTIAILIYITASSIERLALTALAYGDNQGRLGELLLAFPVGILMDAAMACLLALPRIGRAACRACSALTAQCSQGETQRHSRSKVRRQRRVPVVAQCRDPAKRRECASRLQGSALHT